MTKFIFRIRRCARTRRGIFTSWRISLIPRDKAASDTLHNNFVCIPKLFSPKSTRTLLIRSVGNGRIQKEEPRNAGRRHGELAGFLRNDHFVWRQGSFGKRVQRDYYILLHVNNSMPNPQLSIILTEFLQLFREEGIGASAAPFVFCLMRKRGYERSVFLGKINHGGFNLDGYNEYKRHHYDIHPEKRVRERINNSMRFLERMGCVVSFPDQQSFDAKFAAEVQRTKERTAERRGTSFGALQ